MYGKKLKKLLKFILKHFDDIVSYSFEEDRSRSSIIIRVFLDDDNLEWQVIK